MRTFSHRRVRYRIGLVARLKSPMRIHACNLAYIAGLIDGEGSISISKAPHLTLRIYVANSDLPVLQWVQSVLGCGKIRARKKSSSHSHYRTVYNWYVDRDNAEYVLRRLQRWIRIKRFQAILGRRFMELRRRAWNNARGKGKGSLTETRRHKELMLYELIRKANHGLLTTLDLRATRLHTNFLRRYSER